VKSLGKFPDRFLEEIAGQPGAIRRAAAGLSEQAGALATVADLGSTRIVFTGMGASLAACVAPVTVLGGRGVAADLVEASELLHFRSPMLRAGGVLVAVSQSGESAEVIRLVQSLAGEQRPMVVTVTNGLENPLAVAADVALDTRAGEEMGPSTLTFASAVVVLAALAEVLAGRAAADVVSSVSEWSDAAASSAARLLAFPDRLAEGLERWQDGRPTTVVLGRGTARGAAECGALILKEAARLPAEALESGQFRHGPLELAGPGLAAAIVVTEPEAMDLEAALASELADMGSSVALIGPAALDVPGSHRVVLEPVDRSLAPAVAAIPLQLLARQLAVRRGFAPGQLSIARKVTVRE
jgi:glucosamine--fructose-6-phosphate aminotransferase (isomerizing)